MKRPVPYLDRIVTAPHYPKPEGCEGLKSTTVFPDLDHTGIRSKYSEPITHCTSLDGTLTKIWKDLAYIRWKDPSRWNEELNARERTFKAADKIFLNKILIEYDEDKKQSLKRINDHFKGSFDETSFDKNLFAPDSVILEKLNGGDTVTSKSPRIMNISSSRAGTSGSKSERAPTRQRTAFNKMSLFNCLLETREPPRSPVKRFGRATSPVLAGTINNWSIESIRRVNNGDKPIGDL